MNQNQMGQPSQANQNPGVMQPPVIGTRGPMGQPGFPNQPGGGTQPPKPKGIDPDHVPSPVTVGAADAEKFADSQGYFTMSRMPPPLPETKVRIIDDGNCSPLVMRATTNTVPTTKETLQQSKLPLAITLHPLADPSGNGDGSLAVVDHGPEGPIRCTRCKAYINAGVVFTNGGRNWQCNFCPVSNAVPDSYFCNLDHTGKRHDIQSRPELLHGSVEFKATSVYQEKSPQFASYLFVIDVTYLAVKSGVVAAASQAIREVLDLFPSAGPDRPSEAKIGIITYGGGIQFYNLTSGLGQPQMMVVTDIGDPFVPLKSGLFVNVSESREIIENLLDQLPHMFQHTKAQESYFGAAIDASVQAMKDNGGRMIVFTSSLPSAGPGALKNREDNKLLGSDKETTLFTPQNSYYDHKAKNSDKSVLDCVKAGIAVDLFFCHHSYADVSTIGPLAHRTGGSITMLRGFQSHLHTTKLVKEVRKIITRRHGFDAIMRVRTSQGLRPVDFYGSFVMENTTDMEMAGVDEDKSVLVRCQYDDKLPENKDACFQAAILYTTSTGERIIRVHTLTCPVGNQVAEVFRGADMPATISTIGKMAAKQCRDKPLKEIRFSTTQQCVEILGAYRKHCTNPNTSSGQLILPETLKLLPLYTNSLHKMVAFRGGGVVGPDERMSCMFRLLSLRIDSFMVALYPRMVQVDDLIAGTQGIPASIRPSYARLKDHGAYIIENGENAMMWVGAKVSPSFISQVLGAPSFQAIDMTQTKLPQCDNDLSRTVQGVLSALNADRKTHLNFSLAKQKDPSELNFAPMLVEDKSADALSYVDYLCANHRDIQTINQ